MSARYQFSQNERAAPWLSADPKVSPVVEGPLRQCSMIEAGEEAKGSLADYAHLKQAYLFLVERINRLEAENTDLRRTVQFYQDVCLDDYT